MPDRPEDAGAVQEQPVDSSGHAGVGSKVDAIIGAAEAAAEEIRQDARAEARKILQRAEQQAAAQIEELTREAAQSRAEADEYARDLREAADSYGTQHRRSAENDARRVLAGAEEQAAALLDGAQRKAEEIDRDVGERHTTLKREARMLEERRRRVLESLRDLAAQLQDALAEPKATPQEEELMDALDLESRR
jgi:hypothetical protein